MIRNLPISLAVAALFTLPRVAFAQAAPPPVLAPAPAPVPAPAPPPPPPPMAAPPPPVLAPVAPSPVVLVTPPPPAPSGTPVELMSLRLMREKGISRAGRVRERGPRPRRHRRGASAQRGQRRHGQVVHDALRLRRGRLHLDDTRVQRSRGRAQVPRARTARPARTGGCSSASATRAWASGSARRRPTESARAAWSKWTFREPSSRSEPVRPRRRSMPPARRARFSPARLPACGT